MWLHLGPRAFSGSTSRKCRGSANTPAEAVKRIHVPLEESLLALGQKRLWAARPEYDKRMVNNAVFLVTLPSTHPQVMEIYLRLGPRQMSLRHLPQLQ